MRERCAEERARLKQEEGGIETLTLTLTLTTKKRKKKKRWQSRRQSSGQPPIGPSTFNFPQAGKPYTTTPGKASRALEANVAGYEPSLFPHREKSTEDSSEQEIMKDSEINGPASRVRTGITGSRRLRSDLDVRCSCRGDYARRTLDLRASGTVSAPKGRVCLDRWEKMLGNTGSTGLGDHAPHDCAPT